jgi:hypothetical protein
MTIGLFGISMKDSHKGCPYELIQYDKKDLSC